MLKIQDNDPGDATPTDEAETTAEDAIDLECIRQRNQEIPVHYAAVVAQWKRQGQL